MTSQIELAFSHRVLFHRGLRTLSSFKLSLLLSLPVFPYRFVFVFVNSCHHVLPLFKLDPSVLFRVSSIILGTICYRLYIIFWPLSWTGTSLIGKFRMDWMLRIHMISNKRFISFLSNLNLITCLPLSLSLKGGCVKIWPIWEWEKDSLQKTKDAPVRTNPSADTIEREENCQEWKWSTALCVYPHWKAALRNFG